MKFGSVILGLAVLVELPLVIDRRVHKYSDIIYRTSIASRGKNYVNCGSSYTIVIMWQSCFSVKLATQYDIAN